MTWRNINNLLIVSGDFKRTSTVFYNQLSSAIQQRRRCKISKGPQRLTILTGLFFRRKRVFHSFEADNCVSNAASNEWKKRHGGSSAVIGLHQIFWRACDNNSLIIMPRGGYYSLTVRGVFLQSIYIYFWFRCLTRQSSLRSFSHFNNHYSPAKCIHIIL